MNISPHRIVGLIAAGLITGALAKLVLQWAALRGGVLATFEVDGERFRAWVTDPQTISGIYRLHRGESTANIPNGRVLRGPGRAGHNAPYHWHLDPQDIDMAESVVEDCDVLPSQVEENLDEFVGTAKRFCPKNARLVKLRDYTFFGRVG